MNTYQKIVELQDEIERFTGLRPSVDIRFHLSVAGPEWAEDAIAKEIRDKIAQQSNGEMSSADVYLEDPESGDWTCYKGVTKRDITVDVHGPRHINDVTAAS